jgi:hypothetical protein
MAGAVRYERAWDASRSAGVRNPPDGRRGPSNVSPMSTGGTTRRRRYAAPVSETTVTAGEMT